MSKPVRLSMALACLLALVAVGCGGSDSSSSTATSGGRSTTADATPPRYAFANANESGALFVLLHRGVASAARTVGAEVTFYDNKFDGPTALNNARLIAQDKPDLAFEFNAVAGVGTSVGTLFSRAEIPCIAVNVPNEGCAWFNLDNAALGSDMAAAIAPLADEKGWTGEETTVLLVQAAMAGEDVNGGIRTFYGGLQDALPGMDRTDPAKLGATTTTIGDTGLQVDGKGTLDDSYTAVATALQSVPKDRNLIVFAINDDSALGAWRAIERAGRAETTMLASVGGGAEAIDQLRENPSWVAEGDVFFYYWGEYLMAMAQAVRDGATPPERTTSPQVVLTKDNVEEYYKPGETLAHTLPPLAPVEGGKGNAYLEQTGVLQKFGNVSGLEG